MVGIASRIHFVAEGEVMSTHMWQGRWRGRRPAGDIHQRARNVISPSGGIVRGKFPSRKNGRMVHHEGMLELGAIYLFETSPQIVRYREQPTTIHYPDGSRLRRYTPDFELVLVTGELVMVEVKPTRFLEVDKTRHKFDCIEEYMRRSNRPFVILTEKCICQEPRLSNLRWVYHATSRVPPTLDAAQAALGKYGGAFPTSIKTAKELLAEYSIEPFSLLLLGLLRCELVSPLTLSTIVNLSMEADDGWFWIEKKYAF
jgi:hypothetical protein